MVVVIPEQSVITAVWFDVVDGICRGEPSFPLADLAQEVVSSADRTLSLADKPFAILAPPCVISAFCRSSSFLVVHAVVIRTGLPLTAAADGFREVRHWSPFLFVVGTNLLLLITEGIVL